MFDLSPTCQNCGVPIRDMDKHQAFHDLIATLYQRAFDLTDEDFERNTGMSAAERDARIVAAAEALKASAGAAPESTPPHPSLTCCFAAPEGGRFPRDRRGVP